MNSTDVFNYIFECFNKQGVEYVILHSYEKLPFEFESDIDTALNVSSIKKAIDLLEKTLNGTDWRIVQFWRHEFYAADCVISNDKEFLQIDFCTHYERDGRLLIEASKLVENRRMIQNFYVPDPSVEFTYILIKKVLKRKFKDGSIGRLERLLEGMSEDEKAKAQQIIALYFGVEGAASIWDACCKHKYEELDLQSYASMIRKTTSTITGNLKYWAYDLYRRAFRVAHPTGLFVALLGVDGSGKSTIAASFTERYNNAFRKIHHYHSRVRVLKDLNQVTKTGTAIDVTKPHAKRKYGGTLVSIVKLGYYLLDFMIGNYIITKDKIKSTLVLIERYYYDYYIDPVRYNLHLPAGYIEFWKFLVKKPDIIIVLVGDPQTLYERKKEISIQEVVDQIERLKTKFKRKKNVVYIDTTACNVDGSVNQMLKHCNDILRRRCENRI